MKYLILALSLVFVMPVYASKIDKEMKGFKGQSIDKAMIGYGAPDQSHALLNGGFVYTWKSTWSRHGNHYTCVKSFITDKKKIIINWTYRGC